MWMWEHLLVFLILILINLGVFLAIRGQVEDVEDQNRSD